MAHAGFAETQAADEADLIVLNTCHIREKAAEKVYSELGRIRRLKEGAARDGRRVIVAVAGCVAQAEGEEIIRRAPVVDLVLGPQNYHRLPELVARAERGRARSSTRSFRSRTSSIVCRAASRAATRARGVTAFVTVQEGCDKFCTFCVVPYTRGAEVSRPVAKIVDEVERSRRCGRARGDADRAERERLPRRGADGRPWSLAQTARARWRISPASSACAT